VSTQGAEVSRDEQKGEQSGGSVVTDSGEEQKNHCDLLNRLRLYESLSPPSDFTPFFPSTFCAATPLLTPIGSEHSLSLYDRTCTSLFASLRPLRPPLSPRIIRRDARSN
jgi:hypothetical protein